MRIHNRALMANWGPPIAAAAVIFLLSSIPGDRLPGQPGLLSVLAHLLEYGLLAYLLAKAFLATGVTHGRIMTVLSVTIICLGYGIVDELHQLLTPYRVFDPYDLAADTVGALFSSIVYAVRALGQTT